MMPFPSIVSKNNAAHRFRNAETVRLPPKDVMRV